MQVSIAFHLIGMVMWVGGLMIITKLAKMAAAGQPAMFAPLRRTYFSFVIGGLTVSLVSGLYQIMSQGMAFYMKQGWFHGKLTCLIILFVVTAVLGAKLTAATKGESVAPGTFGKLHALTGAMLLAIVILTSIVRMQAPAII